MSISRYFYLKNKRTKTQNFRIYFINLFSKPRYFRIKTYYFSYYFVVFSGTKNEKGINFLKIWDFSQGLFQATNLVPWNNITNIHILKYFVYLKLYIVLKEICFPYSLFLFFIRTLFLKFLVLELSEIYIKLGFIGRQIN